MEGQGTSFGQYLRMLRLERGLTQADLAEGAFVSERLISDYERGAVHRPRRDTVRLLSDALELAGEDRNRFQELARQHTLTPLTNVDSLTRLPPPPGRVIGRELAVEELKSKLTLASGQVLTLTGPGGVGKTCLALELGRQAGNDYSNGVAFVDLAGIHVPELVIPAIAQTLQIKLSRSDEPVDQLADALRGRSALVILDNFEQVVEAAPLVANLAGRCPELRILVTSRVLLRVRTERAFVVQPLEVPPEDQRDIEHLSDIGAIQLFIERANGVDESFALTNENAATIAAIAVHLEGLPLAIELAVARLPVLSPAALLQRMDQSLLLLRGGASDLPERQQALESTIRWSYDLLDPFAQTLLRRLSVFSGGFTLDAAEFILHATTGNSSEVRLDVVDGLMSLTSSSLIRAESDQHGNRRFRMQEIIREFGHLALRDEGELDTTLAAQATWSCVFVESLSDEPRGYELASVLEAYEAEQANIRTSLAWTIANGLAEEAQRIAAASAMFWVQRDYVVEGKRWLEASIGVSQSTPKLVLANALHALAYISCQGNDCVSDEVARRALALYLELGDGRGVSFAWRTLGRCAASGGDFEEATRRFQRSLDQAREIQDPHLIVRALTSLGLTAYDQQNYTLASDYFLEALIGAREADLAFSATYALNNLALVSIDLGDFERALTLQQEALANWMETGHKMGYAHSFENVALIAQAVGKLRIAAILFGAAQSLRERVGVPGRLVDLEHIAIKLAEMEAALGRDTVADLLAQGAGLSLNDAANLALDL